MFRKKSAILFALMAALAGQSVFASEFICKAESFLPVGAPSLASEVVWKVRVFENDSSVLEIEFGKSKYSGLVEGRTDDAVVDCNELLMQSKCEAKIGFFGSRYFENSVTQSEYSTKQDCESGFLSEAKKKLELDRDLLWRAINNIGSSMADD